MSNRPSASQRPARAAGKKKTTGRRVGKSRPEKAANQRNRILSKAKAGNFRITEDGHFERL